MSGLTGFTLARWAVATEDDANRLAKDAIGMEHPNLPGFVCDKARVDKGISWTWFKGEATNVRYQWGVCLEFGRGESF